MSKYSIKTNKLPKSEIEAEIEISSEHLAQGKKKAIEKFNNTLSIPGFRVGKIPENIILENVGEAMLLEEAAEFAINEHFPEILKELGYVTIGRPSVSIIKLAFGNPLVFKIKTSILPEFKLPDYRKISSNFVKASQDKQEIIEPTEKEVEDVLLQIRKNKAHADWHKENPNEERHDKHPDFEDENNLPKLSNDFAKVVGGFETLDALKVKITENLINDKKFKNAEKRRASIMEALIEKTEIDVPELLIESEIEKSIGQIKDDIVRIGGKFEDYLAHAKKTEVELRQDLRTDAEKKAKIQLIFNKIAEVEKIIPDNTIVEHEVNKILEYYPEAKEENARVYVTTMILNQEVLKLLESA